MSLFLSHCNAKLNSSTILEALVRYSISKYLRGAFMKETNCNGCPKPIDLPRFVPKPKVPPKRKTDPKGEYLDISADPEGGSAKVTVNETDVDRLFDERNAALFTPKGQNPSSFKVNTGNTKYEVKQTVINALILQVAADPAKAGLLGWLKEFNQPKIRRASAILAAPLNLKHPSPKDFCVSTADNYYADLENIYHEATDSVNPFYDTGTDTTYAATPHAIYELGQADDSGASAGIYDRGDSSDSDQTYGSAVRITPPGSDGKRRGFFVVPVEGGGMALYATAQGDPDSQLYDNTGKNAYGVTEEYGFLDPTLYASATDRPPTPPGMAMYAEATPGSNYGTIGSVAPSSATYDYGGNNTVYGTQAQRPVVYDMGAAARHYGAIGQGGGQAGVTGAKGMMGPPGSQGVAGPSGAGMPRAPTPPTRRAAPVVAASAPGLYLQPMPVENPYGSTGLYVNPTYLAANSPDYEAPCTIPVDAKELDPVIFPCGCAYHLYDVLKASSKIGHFQGCYYCLCAISRALPLDKIYTAVIFIIPKEVREALIAKVEKVITVRSNPRRRAICYTLLAVGGIAAVATALGVVFGSSGSSSSPTTAPTPPLADTDLIQAYNQTRNASGDVLPAYGTFVFDQVLMVINNTAFIVWNSTTAVACQAAASQISVLTGAGVATVALLNRIANVFIGARSCNVALSTLPPSTTTTTSTTSTRTTITTTPATATTTTPTTLTSTSSTTTSTATMAAPTTTTPSTTTSTSTSSTLASTLTSSMTTTLSSTTSTASTTSTTTAMSTTAATTAATTTLAQTTPALTTLLTTSTTAAPTTTSTSPSTTSSMTTTIPTTSSTSTTITTTPPTTATPTTVTSTTTTSTSTTTPTTTTKTTTTISTTASTTTSTTSSTSLTTPSTTTTTTTLTTTSTTSSTTTTSTSTTTTKTTSTTTTTITTTPTTTTVTTTTKSTTTLTTAHGNTDPTQPFRRNVAHTTPRTIATITLTPEAKGALQIAIDVNQVMHKALTIFTEATGRKVDSSLSIPLTHQSNILTSQSATNYNPTTITTKDINYVLDKNNEYLRKLNPAFSETDVELPPLRGKSDDAFNKANYIIRRNLAAMGRPTKPGDYVKVKASEAIKAAMREEMYTHFYNPYTQQ
jgi:hypothetical protein